MEQILQSIDNHSGAVICLMIFAYYILGKIIELLKGFK